MSDNAKELPKIRVWKKDEMSKRIAFFKDLKGSKKGYQIAFFLNVQEN